MVENPEHLPHDALIAAASPAAILALIAMLRKAEGDLEARGRAYGWLYLSDEGIEWSKDHPVTSGQVPDARSIRRGTLKVMLGELKAAWEAHEEAIQSEGRLRGHWSTERARAEAAEARIVVLEGALEKIKRLRPGLDDYGAADLDRILAQIYAVAEAALDPAHQSGGEA